jgi:hypothetical protein
MVIYLKQGQDLIDTVKAWHFKNTHTLGFKHFDLVIQKVYIICYE